MGEGEKGEVGWEQAHSVQMGVIVKQDAAHKWSSCCTGARRPLGGVGILQQQAQPDLQQRHHLRSEPGAGPYCNCSRQQMLSEQDWRPIYTNHIWGREGADRHHSGGPHKGKQTLKYIATFSFCRSCV